MKKIIALLLAVIIVFSLSAVPVFAIDAQPEGETKNLLLLGDSIAQGFGVANPEQACYGRIVADTNGWNYQNFARVAYDTGDLIYQLENIYSIRDAVKNADIINLCTGSNNYLANKDVVKIAALAIFGLNNKKIDEIADWIFSDYQVIYDMIREMNPDCTIVMNKIYCAWRGLGHIPFDKAVKKINAQIEKLKALHEEIILFDTGSVMTHNPELTAADCVHPNAKGNVELAKAMLKLLNENGLCEKTEPVITVEGIDYDFYSKMFGKFAGGLVGSIVRFFTWNY
ncbi:MAG: SGNH/GDSL hydrolase family protein [Clostridiales bacterium]|nr:SGNH/GDSL hydrolase family protein [Clostridiales bacterium]